MDKEQQEGIGIRWCGGHRTRWRMRSWRRGFLAPLIFAVLGRSPDWMLGVQSGKRSRVENVRTYGRAFWSGRYTRISRKSTFDF